MMKKKGIASISSNEKRILLRIANLVRNGKISEVVSFIEEGKKSNVDGFNQATVDYIYAKSRAQLVRAVQVIDSSASSHFSASQLKDKLSHELAVNFKALVVQDSKCHYQQAEHIHGEPIVSKLLNARTVAELEKLLPYKGKIYLPTDKYSESDQICGIKKTAAYLSKVNYSATHARLKVLRSLIQESGFSECLIIANGPSLKMTNVAMYGNAFIIGLNSIFLHPYINPHVIVCEDHLVGEDRSQELNDQERSVKVIPGYLTYCVDPNDLTIVLNHRPRISFPVDIDFSDKVDEITYTGGTVTYTALQLAVGLGFKKICLVGVDATYNVENVKEQSSYGTGILESLGEDPNHFNSSYFGKGYRWHDPNPLRMMQAYSVAERYAAFHGVNIINLTRGGKLDVFKREDYQGYIYSQYPKIGVIDWIDINSKAATGEVKKALFKEWPKDKLLHVYSPGPADVSVYRSTLGDVFIPDHSSILPAWKTIIEGSPGGFYWRPTHNRPILNLFTALLLSIERKPYALHLMDYWTAKVHDVQLRQAYEQAIEYSISASAHFFVISQRMKGRLCEKYPLQVERVTVAHNYSPASLELALIPSQKDNNLRLIFYSGNLDPDQSIDPLMDICKAVESLNINGPYHYKLIVRTSESHVKASGHLFGDYEFVDLQAQSDTYEEYIRQMAKVDLCILCYGFGSESRAYLLDSMANKLPDLVTAKCKFFAYGDPEIGTLSYLASAGYPFVLLKRDLEAIAENLQSITSMSYAEYAVACSESFSIINSEFSEMAQCHVFQKQLSSCVTDGHSSSCAATDYAPLVSCYQDILRCSDVAVPKGVDDELQLMQFLADRRELIAPVYELVREHGLGWSINSTRYSLEKNIASIPTDQRLVIQALAWMIASQRHSRFADLWSKLFGLIVHA